MSNVIIERIPSNPLLSCKDFNTNNYPKESNPIEFPKVCDLDYETEVARTNLIYWRNIINYPIIFEYTFTKDEIYTLKESFNIGIIAGRLPVIYKEEIDDIIKRLSDVMSKFNAKYGWFIRFNRSSPKDGIGSFPLMTAEQVIKQIVTSNRAAQAIYHNDTTIYFCKFDPKWDSERELRVFIYNGKVTAISQYSCYHVVDIFANMKDNGLTTITNNITNIINILLPQLILSFNTNSFVCDVYVNHDSSIKIIEFNSFGYWLASGSGLFDWKNDYEKLYNTDNKIYFRILTI